MEHLDFKLFRFIKWIIKYLLNFQYPRKFTKIHKDLLIVGNGPSLDSFDFSIVNRNQVDILCVNDFALQKEKFLSLKPEYYCLVDPLYFIEDEYLELKSILKNVSWKMTIITYEKNDFNINDNDNISVLKINNNILEDDKKFIYILYELNIASPRFQNVIISALYFAISSHIQNIYLIGVENDWHKELSVDQNNHVFRTYKHFYGKSKINLTLENHIGEGELYKYFYWYFLTLFEYNIMKKYANYMKCSVINLTVNSYIDSFRKQQNIEVYD